MSWCWVHRALQFWGKQNRLQTQMVRQHRTIPALRLKHRSGSCGTAFALPKCSIMSGCGTRIVLRGQKPLALCDRCPCFGSLFPPLAALTFAASNIICAFGLASAAPRSPYRHLELCGIALTYVCTGANNGENKSNLYINGKKCFEKLLSLAEGMQTKLCILPKIKTFRCTVETHLNLC